MTPGAAAQRRAQRIVPPVLPAETPPNGLSGEAAQQALWAGGSWPWLPLRDGGCLRVVFSGLWNRRAGPDFRGAVLLAPDGGRHGGRHGDRHGDRQEAHRVLRGDVELHCREAGWRRHGHDRDAAYQGVILHAVADLSAAPPAAAGDAPPMPRFSARFPPPLPASSAPRLPCHGLAAAAGARPLQTLLLRLARRRLRAKLRALLVGNAAGNAAGRVASDASVGDGPDQFAYRALLRGFGKGGNGPAFDLIADRLSLAALPASPAGTHDGVAADAALIAAAFDAVLAEASQGAAPRWAATAGRPANRLTSRLQAAAALIARFRRGDGLAAGLVALASLPEAEALRALHVPARLGAERARQLLVDVIYPLALALPPLPASAAQSEALVARWLRLGGARYGRTSALRRHLDDKAALRRDLDDKAASRRDLDDKAASRRRANDKAVSQGGGRRRWRNGETQALLELERGYCRHGACAICPLAALARPLTASAWQRDPGLMPPSRALRGRPVPSTNV